MKQKSVCVVWPNGIKKNVNDGDSWIEAANQCGITIPTGCLRGSCGACEIEVNGNIIRACISEIKSTLGDEIQVRFLSDDLW